MRFEWDEHKNESNWAKHKISFEEAVTVFEDKNAVVISDKKIKVDKDNGEDRFIIYSFTG